MPYHADDPRLVPQIDYDQDATAVPRGFAEEFNRKYRAFCKRKGIPMNEFGIDSHHFKFGSPNRSNEKPQ